MNTEKLAGQKDNTDVVELCLPWPPSGNVQARHTKAGGHYLNPKVAAYRGQVAGMLTLRGWGLRGRPPMQGPVEVVVLASPPDKRATDADNRLKCLLDALVHGGLLADDSNRVIKRLAWEWFEPVKYGVIHLTVRGLA